MLDWLVRSVLDFVGQYGYLAVFVYMVLETGYVLHFVPSEVVVPLAASQLVHDGPSFVLFVLDATAGATVGSLLAYGLFGRYGRGLLSRYGHVVHLSEDRVEWSQDVFLTYGESSVFWGRVLPFLRTLVSIPAGLAAMDLRRFVVYSAAGAAIFNTGLTYLVYTGRSTTSPLGLAATVVGSWVALQVAYVQTHEKLVVVLLGVLALLATWIWMSRGWIEAHPETAKAIGLHAVRIVGVLAGALFVVGALSSPHRAFAAVTWAWDDPRFLVGLGLTEQVALLLTGVLAMLVGILVYEFGRLVRLAHVRWLRAAVEARLGR